MSCNSENAWDQDKVIQLIESYREKHVLWNPKEKSYFNKIKKNDAWVELSNLYSCDIGTIKGKNSLLSSFRREKASKTKMKTLTGKGTI